LFLKSKFPTSKRFGIEGCDITIPALKTLVECAGDEKCNHLVFGMAHRGRLNTLGLVFQKPLSEIFAEFKESKAEQNFIDEKVWGKSGDVKVFIYFNVLIKSII
jgi:2-oxoglutarate dehydrogenase E1 component